MGSTRLRHNNPLALRLGQPTYRIKVLNAVAQEGLDLLRDKGADLIDNLEASQGVLLRSARLDEQSMPKGLLAVARVGAGTDNIPIDHCTQHGIMVFNTPGANANAVKELVMASLLLSFRNIVEAVNVIKTLDGKANLSEQVESIKKRFRGKEIRGKILGVVGLGAIGESVCEIALAFGMKVFGYDPYVQIEPSRFHGDIEQAQHIQDVLRRADCLTFHVPSNPSTTGMVNKTLLSQAKPGVKIFNFSRESIIDIDALIEGLQAKNIDGYVTDFVDRRLIGMERVHLMPHLGASTEEAEINCSLMASKQLWQYLRNGNAENTVNFPSLHLEAKEGLFRLSLIHANVPKMMSHILDVIGQSNINILDMLNRSAGKVAYTLLDTEEPIDDKVQETISQMTGVFRARSIEL